MRHSILSFCLAILAASISSATTYLVEPDGTGDFPTIQAALDAVLPGDVIELADGVFVDEGNRDVDFHGIAVTVRSQSGDPESCVIDCDGSPSAPHRGFHFHSSEGGNSVLSGVTIRDGHELHGGGVTCYYSSPAFENVVFRSNSAAEHGGGLACIDASPSLQECTFVDNTSDVKGGGSRSTL